MIILDDIREPDEALVVANRIALALEEPVEIAGRDVSIGSSIGVARGTPGEITATELLARADASMYAAKSQGKGRRSVYGE